MPNGYCPAILRHIESLAGCDPAKRLSPQGFLQAVLKTMDGSATLNDAYRNGHVVPLTVKYRERPLASTTLDTMPDCVTASTNPYKEFTLPNVITKSRSFWVPMSTIRQYCEDASRLVNITGANFSPRNLHTQVMSEVYDLLLSEAAALISAIDLSLVTQMSTQFGKNLHTGSNAAEALEFDPVGAANSALFHIMSDMRENEFCDFGNVSFVGTGPFINLELFKNWWGNCCDASGLNKAVMMNAFPNMFYDKNTRAVWGTDNVGVFENGSIGLISAPKYVGSFAGRVADSEYFTLNFPVNEVCCPQQFLDRLTIDVQIKEFDCNPTLAIDGGAAAPAGGPGVMVMLSWTGSLWVRPDMFRTGDPMDGANGTLRYQISEPVVAP